MQSYTQRYASSQWSKCCGVAEWVHRKSIGVNVKEHVFFFVRWERDQYHDSKKEQEFCITSGNLIGLLPKMSFSDWLLQQQTAYHKNSESSEVTSSWTFIHENTNSTLSRIIIGIAWLISASSVVWIFMYDGKVAYQTARLVAIEIKKKLSCDLSCVPRILRTLVFSPLSDRLLKRLLAIIHLSGG